MNSCTLPNRTRRGNTIVIAMGVFLLVTVMVVSSTDSAIVTSHAARQVSLQQQGLAALDTVISRHQLDVVQLANLGDATVISDVSKWPNGVNYGCDMVGNAEVRWKVEPVRTPSTDGYSSDINFIANPSPDGNWTPPTSRAAWNPNDNTYLFRVAAEARVGTDSLGRPQAVVQGARYASVNKEPLFRYVIFYAQSGPKGDLELSHADPVNIQGSVHTNGALYVGGGLKVNDKMLRLGSIDGNMNPTTTIIGPDAPVLPKTPMPVRVNGVDGIFRMSKPLMYAVINDFPLSDGSNALKFGSAAATNGPALVFGSGSSYTPGTGPSGAYNLAPNLIGTSETTLPNVTSVAAATSNGQFINPFRILDGNIAITENLFTGAVYTSPTATLSGSRCDDWRMIANSPTLWTSLRGISQPSALPGSALASNDSRDWQRIQGAPASAWKATSLSTVAPGFNGFARTKDTGQGVKKLPAVLANQGMEPQPLNYIDYDGNALTDQHEYARPRFMKADGTQTTDFPNAPGATTGFPNWTIGSTAAVVEAAGQYLRYALGGSDSYMARYPDGTGWTIRTLTGGIPADPVQPGLIIRERPIPETNYWPGPLGGSIVDSNSLRWLPYAYGKHWYPNLSPFTIADISDQVFPGSADPFNNRINTAAANRIVSYAANGRLTVTTAQTPWGTTGSIATTAGSPAGYNYNRYPYYYGQNWRFIHLKKASATATNGLLATVFSDMPSGTNLQSLCSNPVTLTAPAGGIQPTITLAGISPMAINTSARLEGFLTAPTSNTFEFYVPSIVGCTAKVWVNNTLVWSNWGLSIPNLNPACYLRLTQGVQVPIQVDFTISNTSPTFSLQWRNVDVLPLPAYATIPTTALTTRTQLGFTRSQFTSVQMRIDRPSSIPATPAQAKIGLMLRDATGGMSPLLSGTAPYVFLGWSPTRGFFIERRPVRHLQDTRTIGVWYIGNGVDSGSNPCDGFGQIGQDSTLAANAAVNRSAYLKEIARTAITTVTGTVAYGTGITYGSQSWTTAPNFSGTMSRDVGGGKVWTLLNGFTVGSRSASRTAQPYSYSQQSVTKYLVQTVQLNSQATLSSLFYPSNASIPATDSGQTLYVFTNPTGTGQFSGVPAGAPAASTTLSWTAAYATVGSVIPSGTNSPWYFYSAGGGPIWTVSTAYILNQTVPNGTNLYVCTTPGTSAASGSGPTGTGTSIADGTAVWKYLGVASGSSSAGCTQLRRRYGNSGTNTNYNYGTTTTLATTVGDTNTIWGSVSINKNGTVSSASQSDINTVTGMAFTAMNPSLPTLSLPTPVSYPANPAAPTTPTVADPIAPDFTTGSGRTFSVKRASGSIIFDLNSFVSGSATWFTSAVAQYLPWGTGTTWNGFLPTTVPTTQGFRPDAWKSSSAPVLGAAASGVTGGISVPSVGAPYTNGWQMNDDVKPAALATATEVWLRIEQSGTPAKLHYKCFVGTTKPTGASDPGWTELYPATAPTDISGWGSDLLIGPALQSGDINTSVSATLTNLAITTTAAAPNDVIDATDWDQGGTGGVNALVKYLASQYQVFWGPREITEDFFAWVDPATGTNIASEDWFWNPREFWSQSKWWDLANPATLIEKDFPYPTGKTTWNTTTLREAMGKVTLLTLDMRNLQDYLSTRLFSDATTYRVTGGGGSYNTGWPVIAPATPSDYTLSSKFSGLVYAVRTNRYPWNPVVLPKPAGVSPLRAMLNETPIPTAVGGVNASGINPWSPVASLAMPNSSTLLDDLTPDVADRTHLDNWAPGADLAGPGPGGPHKLQPYPATILPEAPAFRPQDFHHGVRLINGSSIDWGFSGTKTASSSRFIGSSGTIATTWTRTPTPTFGAGKTSIVTPNPLYIQGNLNVDQTMSDPGTGVPVAKFTPLAIMGDSITLLSNSWKDTDYQVPGLTVTNVAGSISVGGGGTLACTTLGAVASDSEYNAAIATKNQPTTRERVAEGQAAPFVDATQFLENWNGKSMTYLGSLVVLDTRRYTQAFLLDTYKTYGQTPFGITGSGAWLNVFTNIGLYGRAIGGADWLGQSPIIYSEPIRLYKFNYDLTTPQGTPPFAPFGVATSGVGGWARAIR